MRRWLGADSPSPGLRPSGPAALARQCSTIHTDRAATDPRGRYTANRRVRSGLIPGTSTHWPWLMGTRAGGPDTTIVPPGTSSRSACGSRFSTLPAHRMTTAPNVPLISCGRLSTRPAITRARSSASSLSTVDRNDTLRARDSISARSRSDRTILMGIPGNPAPEPRSATDPMSAGRTRRNSRLSRNRFSTIHPGSVEPTSRWIFCHF